MGMRIRKKRFRIKRKKTIPTMEIGSVTKVAKRTMPRKASGEMLRLPTLAALISKAATGMISVTR
jgi:hypothetical protein